MTSPAIMLMDWDGEAMVPRGRVFANMADRTFTVGECYRMAVVEERSIASHRHYFAAIHEAWMNLPEEEALRHPTPEHLRKYALIRCGYRDERSIVCASKAEAERVAAFIRPMDDYAVVTFSESVVRVWTAKSQSMRAMGKKEFGESKQGVLDFVAGLIGVKPEELVKQVEAA